MSSSRSTSADECSDSTQLHCYNLVKSLKIGDQTPQHTLSKLWSPGMWSTPMSSLHSLSSLEAVMASPLIAAWRQAFFHLLPTSLGSSLPTEYSSLGCNLCHYISGFRGRWLRGVDPLDPTDQNTSGKSHLFPKALREKVTSPQTCPTFTSKMSPWFALPAMRCNNTKAHTVVAGREFRFWPLLGACFNNLVGSFRRPHLQVAKIRLLHVILLHANPLRHIGSSSCSL